MLKKIFISLGVAFVLAVFLSMPINTFAYDSSDTGWVIDNFTSKIDVGADRHVTVDEKIDVDFGSLYKHGIYRYIPYKYNRNGNNYDVRIDVISVKDGNGNSIPYEKSKSDGNLEIKIGDADKTITGKQTYEIEYELDRVINGFSDHDELYWNVTGNDWPVTIENASAEITWPEGAQVFDNTCFLGSYGSTLDYCKVSSDQNKVVFDTTDKMYPGEGFTVVSGIVPGLVENYSIWTQIWWFISDNWAYAIPFVVLFFLMRNYYKKGRDPEDKKKTIVPEFAPPDKLKPAVMGTIYDEKVDTHDISAVIIDLAVQGFIKIKELEGKKILGFSSGKDYQFTDTQKDRKSLDKYEKEVMKGLFSDGKEVKLKDLKYKFYTHIKPIKDDLYNIVKSEDYFEANPESVRNTYFAIGFVIIALGFFVPGFTMIFTGSFFPMFFAFMVSGVLFIIFSFKMPKRTEKGVEITRQIKGFKLYMHTAERYRQKFNEDNKIFEKFLPYAMVFGIVSEWSKKFEKMQIDRPSWYEGRGRFYPVIFASDMVDMQNSMNSTLVSTSSSAGSGGSGFSGGGSGGGFGGGGGGSW